MMHQLSLLSLAPLLLVWLGLSEAAAAFLSLLQKQPMWRTRSSATDGHTAARLEASAQWDPPLPNFCADCGAASMELRIPPGDERLRACCTSCGRIEYSNPKIVVSCVVLTNKDDHENKTMKCLLAKRAIDPRKGTWGIPQGFMEHGETSREAAAREVLEETGAIVHDKHLRFRGVYNVPGSVQLVYEARVSSAEVEQQIEKSTLESSEVRLFECNNLPLEHELSFPTVQWAIEHCLRSAIKNMGDDNNLVHIQQRTKFYDSTRDQWSEYEDESPHLV